MDKSAKNDDAVRGSLCRDTPGRCAIIDHQELVAGRTGEALSIGGSNPCIRTRIQLQLIFGRKQILIKVSNQEFFVGFCSPDKGSLITGRIDQRGRKLCIIEGGYQVGS